MDFNPVVWFEIYVEDIARAQAFYEGMLGVSLAPLGTPEGAGDMQMLAFPAKMENGGAGGTLVKMEGFPPGAGGPIIYFASEDCAVEAGRVEGLGGTVVRDKFSLGEFGFAALVKDTEGNIIGLHSMS